ncbi:MAG: hypothetical protein EXR66_08635 [Dehalococcoidia bacterium]|nr:hypothetical protein [Dehalococcoidia bacterium]
MGGGGCELFALVVAGAIVLGCVEVGVPSTATPTPVLSPPAAWSHTFTPKATAPPPSTATATRAQSASVPHTRVERGLAHLR